MHGVEKMPLHLLIAIFAVAVSCAYAGVPGNGQFNPQTQIGIAEVSDNGDGCLTIMNAALRENEILNLISMQEPQTVIRTHILNKLSLSCPRNTEAPTDASFYSFRIEKIKANLIGTNIAIAGFNRSFRVSGGKVRADLNSDGKLESFRLCASNEGLHVTVWAGEPLISKRLWHEYYYLGYDVEENCNDRDYEQ